MRQKENSKNKQEKGKSLTGLSRLMKAHRIEENEMLQYSKSQVK